MLHQLLQLAHGEVLREIGWLDSHFSFRSIESFEDECVGSLQMVNEVGICCFSSHSGAGKEGGNSLPPPVPLSNDWVLTGGRTGFLWCGSGIITSQRGIFLRSLEGNSVCCCTGWVSRCLSFLSGIWFLLLPVMASAHVVISEVMWMGSDLSTADEWVELTYVQTGSGAFDVQTLDGWVLTVLNSKGEEKTLFTFPAGTNISSGQYVLVGNYDAAHSRLAVEPDFTTVSMTLPNTKLLLRLYDASGAMIDVVDDGVGEPFAGENASGSGSKRSMERLVLSGPGDKKENWASASTFLGFDDGASLFGTPGFPNGIGSTEDVIAPAEASDFTAFILSGTLISQWIPSESLDVAQQEIFVSPFIGSGRILLPASATGWSIFVSSGETFELRLVSIDRSGNISGGVTTIAEIREEDPPDDGPEEGSGMFIHPGVYITEVLANPMGADDNEWIEIGNLGTGSVDIAGWVLDEGNSLDTFIISAEHAGSGAWVPETGISFVFHPGEHVSFRKSVSGLPLGNQGELLSLMSGGIVIDSWAYPETAEEVSYGRDPVDPAIFRAFCRPTEGVPNTAEMLDPFIAIQSGETQGVGKVSMNLSAEVQTGSLASATCSWIYGDGFASESCNPPSHSFAQPGKYTVQLTVQTFCGDVIARELAVEVFAVAPKAKKKQQESIPATQPEELCTPAFSPDVIISEFLPNPYGEEEEGEWVELQNIGSETISLCGWLFDDGEGGSKPYSLGEESITPGQYLLLPRSQTKVALNNDVDAVRLFSGSGNLVAEVTYVKGMEGEAMGLRGDGLFVWTPYPTPGEPNRFRGAERRFPGDRVIVSAALPNPVGKDEEGEWVELANVSDEPFTLDGWFLDNREGGSVPFMLSSITFLPDAIRRFPIQETGLKLTNTSDVARLLDPDGYVVSILGWTEAVEGRIYRPPVLHGERVPARVTNVVDGDTVDIVLTDIDHLDRVPDALRRQWLGIQPQKNPSIRVRLIGIDTPETVHPSKPVEEFGTQASEFTRALLLGKNVELEFDAELYDKYERLLAYVFTEDDTMVQAELLRRGLAYAYLRFPFARRDEFIAYEVEARQAQLGLWSNGAAREIIDLLQQGIEEEVIMEEIGLSLSVDPPSGIVESGTLVTFTASFDANVYFSMNSGAYMLLSGSFVVTEDIVLKAYAENALGTGAVRSEIVEAWYALRREAYRQEVIFSEVYPSPVSSGSKLQTEEWVEIHDVSLAGWIFDDALEGGSKPQVLTVDAVVPAAGQLVLTGAQIGVSLNNDGDEVWLFSPDSSIAIGVHYPKVKKGSAYALVASSWCFTDTPTPYEQNICSEIIPIRKVRKQPKAEKATKKTTSKKSQPRSGFLWERYRNVVATGTGESALYPAVWQQLKPLEKDPVPLKKTSGDTEVLIIVLMILPALRLLTM
ncbi:MAG: Micrococcal nuclease-like protein nuclease [Candidatus Peribacteria bacterium GW2011_GWB1_54_5]|nr:MAG: Micrococcal nuclease-like protein nuclease [Candidatus Peribacteria bacterium GW2011_GWB1_54_5]